MDTTAVENAEERILVLAPTGRDAPLIQDVLRREGIAVEVCHDAAQLCREIGVGAGAMLLAEEALGPEALQQLTDYCDRQPPWSDLPLVILTGGGKTTPGSMRMISRLSPRANVTLLERPVRIITLVTAIQTALRARTRQYEVRNLLEQAQQAVRQRDHFLAILGHELRNPIGAVRTAIEVMEQVKSGNEPLAAEQRDIIRRQTAQVARLVDDLLDVARVTTGKLVLQLRSVDLRDVARRCLAALRALVQTDEHEITLTVGEHPLIVHGDPVRLEQIVINLLTNAVKYSPPPARITISAIANGDEAILRVSDTGVGIPADMLARVFEPFIQDDQSLDRSAGGLGIGLTVVRSLVEMHGGSITVHSAGRGKGSEFTVKLSLAGTIEPSQEPEPTVRAEPRKVLLVEDGADARRALSALLRLWGHHPDVAEDGPQGVERALATHPDVALVDIGLPGLDGYGVARQIRAALGSGIVLVALTGYGQPEDRARAQEAGFNLHLVKPVDPAKLRRLLAQPQAALSDPAFSRSL